MMFDETWLDRNRPKVFAIQLYGYAGILLAGALSVIWLIDRGPDIIRPRLPSIDSISEIVVSPAHKAGKTMEDIARVIDRL